jgi:hypothetical protein
MMSYRDALKVEANLLNLLPAVILGSLPPILSFILTQKNRKIKEAIGEFKYRAYCCFVFFY